MERVAEKDSVEIIMLPRHEPERTTGFEKKSLFGFYSAFSDAMLYSSATIFYSLDTPRGVTTRARWEISMIHTQK